MHEQIYIHGAGALGLSIIKNLDREGYNVCPFACIGNDTEEEKISFSNVSISLMHFENIKKLFSEKKTKIYERRF